MSAPRNLNCVIMPALQQPQWPDRDRLDAVARRLEALPPLVLAAECDQLKDRLAAVGRGEAFLLQGGDCAETFAGSTADSIRGKFQTLLQMAVVLTYAASAVQPPAEPPLMPSRARSASPDEARPSAAV